MQKIVWMVVICMLAFSGCGDKENIDMPSDILVNDNTADANEESNITEQNKIHEKNDDNSIVDKDVSNKYDDSKWKEQQIKEFKNVLLNYTWQIKQIKTKSGEDVSLFDVFGSGIHLSMGSLKFFEDGTFENIPPSIYGEEDIDGKYQITVEGQVILDYDGQYKEIWELSYGGESHTMLSFTTNQNAYTNEEEYIYIYEPIEREIIDEMIEEVYSLDKLVLEETNSSLDEVTMYNVDLDFNGIDEILYYPNKNYEYSTELSVFGIKKDGTFGKVIDACGIKVALVEDKINKEKFYICHKSEADGLCYLYCGILKFEKSNYEIGLKQLFLETCNQDEEEKYREELSKTLTGEEYDNAIFNSHISEYNAYGKSVTKKEYDKLLKEFNEKYIILNSFEVPE